MPSPGRALFLKPLQNKRFAQSFARAYRGGGTEHLISQKKTHGRVKHPEASGVQWGMNANRSKRLPLIVAVMTEWPSGMTTLATREGEASDMGVYDPGTGTVDYVIPQREFFGSVSARHRGNIDTETADDRATREAFRSAAAKYGYR